MARAPERNTAEAGPSESSGGAPGPSPNPGGPVEDLDLRAFDADVVEHVLIGRARARMFEAATDGARWDVDLVAGTLRVGDRQYKAQLLGTWSAASRTFLWGWANPDSGDWPASLAIANRLRERGQLPGQAVYTERKVADDWVRHLELAYVSGEVAGGYPVFLARHDAGYAVLLITDAEVDTTRFSLAYVPGVLLDLPTMSFGDGRACTRRFLERLGFVVQDEGAALAAARGGDAVRVRLDAGRTTEVSFDAGGR